MCSCTKPNFNCIRGLHALLDLNENLLSRKLCVLVLPASVPAAYMCVKQWGRMQLRLSHNRAKQLLLSSL